MFVSDQIPALPISRKLIEAFKAKATMEQVEEILNQIPGPKKEDNSGEGKPLLITEFWNSVPTTTLFSVCQNKTNSTQVNIDWETICKVERAKNLSTKTVFRLQFTARVSQQLVT